MDVDNQSSSTSRMIWLDLWKGMLVFIMILAHCIQFFGDEHTLIQGIVSEFANITTFSAFFFVFGVTNAATNIRKPARSTKLDYLKLAKSFWRYLFAYYISAFAYSILVEDSFFMPRTIHNILSLRVLLGYSEFLLAFAVMQLLILSLYPMLRRMSMRQYFLLTVISLLFTLFPYRQNKEPILGLFTGSEQFYSFPVLPYLIYFVMGLWFYSNIQKLTGKLKWIYIIGSAMLSVPCSYHIVKFKEIPERFPPGLVFILGAAFALPLYIYTSKKLEKLSSHSRIISHITSPLQIMGENSLLFLILSNLVMFALKGTAFYRQSIGFVITIFIIILYLCFFAVRITTKRTMPKVSL